MSRPPRACATNEAALLQGDPAIEPPWRTLTAIDLERGAIRWQVPLGAANGAENYGGPVATAGGLVFIAAAKDEKFRAFDKETGELLTLLLRTAAKASVRSSSRPCSIPLS